MNIINGILCKIRSGVAVVCFGIAAVLSIFGLFAAYFAESFIELGRMVLGYEPKEDDDNEGIGE